MKSSPQQTLTKYVNIIQKLWDTYRFEQFSYEQARSIIVPFKSCNSIPTYMCKYGLLQRNISTLQFTRQPVLPSDAKEILNLMRKIARQYNSRKKTDVVNKSVQQNLFPINEELCIKYLKDKGYRILKPIQPQYEEL